MKHIGTQETATGTVTAEVDVHYYVPRKGDTLNVYGTPVTLTENMQPRVKISYDGQKYIGHIMYTDDMTNRVVFHADGLTWRQGEAY